MTFFKTYREKVLLERIASGDEHAFARLFEKYRDKVYTLGMSLTRSEFLAEEITQEVFLKLWLHKDQLHEVRHFNAYLRTMARNAAFNYLKRIAHERMVLQKIMKDSPAGEFTTDNTVMFNAYQRLLDQAISKLSPQVKKVYLLCRYEGLKQKEIAAMLNLSHYTVKDYMKKALSDIRQYLDEHLD